MYHLPCFSCHFYSVASILYTTFVLRFEKEGEVTFAQSEGGRWKFALHGCFDQTQSFGKGEYSYLVVTKSVR